jgi:hypothetical protein
VGFKQFAVKIVSSLDVNIGYERKYNEKDKRDIQIAMSAVIYGSHGFQLLILSYFRSIAQERTKEKKQ